MKRTEKQFHALTVGDVMSCALVVLPQKMSVATAARLLHDEQTPAAPVTDGRARCIGVLSAADFLRWAAEGGNRDEQGGDPTAGVCSDWQVVDEKSSGRDEVRRYMMGNPLLVKKDTRIAEIVDAFLGPRPRPVVVVDEAQRPLGVVSRKELLSALGAGGPRPETEPAMKVSANQRVLPRRLAPASGRA